MLQHLGLEQILYVHLFVFFSKSVCVVSTKQHTFHYELRQNTTVLLFFGLVHIILHLLLESSPLLPQPV